jgi:hypothetical protein
MHSLRPPLSIPLSLIIFVALMPVPCVSLFRSVIAQKPAERTPRPRPGKPEGTGMDSPRLSGSVSVGVRARCSRVFPMAQS